jgi:hypothetical protein
MMNPACEHVRMPDVHGNFKGMAVPAAAWERIFGAPDPDRTRPMSCFMIR